MNQPTSPVHNYSRDVAMAHHNGADRVHAPNSYGGPAANPAYELPTWQIEATATVLIRALEYWRSVDADLGANVAKPSAGRERGGRSERRCAGGPGRCTAALRERVDRFSLGRPAAWAMLLVSPLVGQMALPPLAGDNHIGGPP